MQFEFDLNTKLKGMEMQINRDNEKLREDRKDVRVDKQAAQQKDMIAQRKTGDSFKKFESHSHA